MALDPLAAVLGGCQARDAASGTSHQTRSTITSRGLRSSKTALRQAQGTARQAQGTIRQARAQKMDRLTDG